MKVQPFRLIYIWLFQTCITFFGTQKKTFSRMLVKIQFGWPLTSRQPPTTHTHFDIIEINQSLKGLKWHEVELGNPFNTSNGGELQFCSMRVCVCSWLKETKTLKLFIGIIWQVVW